MESEFILEIDDVTKTFPGVTALSNVNLKIRRGEIHGLCGENGAGKSTLMKILCGVYPYGSYSGSVRLDGRELMLASDSIRKAIEAGIAIVYQELTLIPNMSVGENIFLGKEPRKGSTIDWNKVHSDSRKLLDRLGLNISPQEIVKLLGVGKMQMAEIAKALSEDAKILILDEPTSALSTAEVDKLMEILSNLRAMGVTCIYISHKLEEFFRITDTVTILRDGKIVKTERTANLNLEKLVGLMVGREMKERFPEGARHPGEVFFKVDNLHALDPNDMSRQVLKGVSFDLRRGEILGIAGLMGSGRTELVSTIFGEYGVVTQGSIELEGKKIVIKSARDAMKHGISMVPEDRKAQGLILRQSILQNISLPNLDRFSSFMKIDKNAEYAQCEKGSRSLSVKAPSVNTAVENLSGGNQQKVVISKWLMSRPRILILDDPTRGIDVGAKYEIYKLMNKLAEEGYAIIMISSELEEVLGMSDRIMVMWEGRSNGTLECSQASQELIMARATGVEMAQ